MSVRYTQVLARHLYSHAQTILDAVVSITSEQDKKNIRTEANVGQPWRRSRRVLLVIIV
jgi:flagellar motor switch protein FliG